MARTSYLMRRGDTWWFVRNVPRDVVDIIGRRQWWQSLRTDAHEIAQRRVRLCIDETDQQIKAARLELERRKVANLPPERRAEIAARLNDMGFLFDADFTPASLSWVGDFLRHHLDARLADQTRGLDYLPPLARQAVETGVRQQLDAEVAAVDSFVREADPENAGGITLTKLLARWKERTKPVELTVQEVESSIRRFYEVNGVLDVREITKAHVAAYKTAVEQMPASMTETQRKMRLPALLESLNGQEYQKISQRTVKKRVSNIRTLLDEDTNLVPVNPAEGIHVKNGKAMKRLPFDRDDLAKMMQVAPFATGDREHKLYWPIMLAMFTGARLGEIAPLTSADVRQEDGVWCLRITDDPETGKRLKTEASRRYVPLHPELVRLGLPEWAAAQKGKLFAFEPYAGKAAHYLSKDFGRWLRGEAGITDPRKVAHSFRHLMKDALRDAGAPDTLQEAILGHEGRTVGDSYGTTYGIAARAAVMEKVRLPVSIP